ncbi:hypothetical protein CKO15_05320 [Halorhodospira abdelmalekii]|uniref:peptidoglycan editing factor PgeF n=1 Tax=Halorhodospira abdelmalekii TaxID=421629 RepID=UPI001908D894|nr:peptidoglycan editing factor PgeF [Halorhodospira abdelmalekii]MBK1734716.1 hypothetical protein [Halorhodospira abdelmalekii]
MVDQRSDPAAALAAGVPDDWLCPEWPAPAQQVQVVTTSRNGGCSVPPYATLNLGSTVGDDPAAVAENRRRLYRCAGVPQPPCWLTQVHGTTVVAAHQVAVDPTAGGSSVTRPVGARTELRDGSTGARARNGEHVSASNETSNAVTAAAVADAAWTDRPGTVCAVLTADCLPVVFAACDGSAVAVAHAGWRGLAAGILERTVAALPVPPERLMAWLGPAIGPRAFGVGPEVVAAFAAHDPRALECFESLAGGWHYADLYALARQRLSECGVVRIYGGGWCTYGDTERFFSYRRDGAQTGRMATLVWIGRPAAE